jgi:BirA family biotin operon repressor/biotin-[acetyl-CoA-carboxylase] ligase
MGRCWNTHRGESIAMSILLKPQISPQDAPSITPVLAIAAVEAVKKETGIDAGIKWPNDIVLDGKKLCGILTEMSAEPDIVNYIVPGIGININQEHFEGEISNIATSLKIFSGNSYDRKKILASVLNIFEVHYDVFKKEGLTPFISYLKEHSVLIGKKVSIEDMRGTITGIADDIDSDGSLLIRKDNGEVVKIYSGDVTTKGFYKV